MFSKVGENRYFLDVSNILQTNAVSYLEMNLDSFMDLLFLYLTENA